MASTSLTTAAAIGGGIVPLVLGAGFIFRPALSGLVFPFLAASSPAEQATADTFTILLGGREIAFGLFSLVVWNKARSDQSSAEVKAAAREILGWGTLLAGTIPFADILATAFARSAGLVNKPWMTMEGSFVALVPPFAWIGARLLGWLGGKAKAV
nr:hypothetical protein B0A51_05023 [Rachicladosporium sp. CCFEE 5018]